jgi:hypothetical protein
MSTLSESIEHLAAVRDAATDPRAAYLIRSRLRRALLSCARGIAERQRLEKPVLPGQWSVTADAPPEICEVVALCRRIYRESEHLCQPSESFDVRWQDGWRTLQRDLAQLNVALEHLG